MRTAHDFISQAADNVDLQPRTPVRPHDNEVAAQLVENLKDVSGAKPVGYNDLMFHLDVRVRLHQALKAAPKVYWFPPVHTGKKCATLRYDGRRKRHVKQDHLGPNAFR